jgi:N-glycosylase/DNA lyase
MLKYPTTYHLALDLLPSVEERYVCGYADMHFQVIWQKLAFCILSSNSRYEAALSAHQSLFASPNLFRSANIDLEELCSDILSRISGIRFARKRSQYLASSWQTLNKYYPDLVSLFSSEEDENVIRQFVVSIFQGIGMKQASMFLRDIGVSRNLAIVDVHILRFIHEHAGVKYNPAKMSEYIMAEKYLIEVAEAHKTSLASFDIALWVAAKAIAKEARC